MSKFVIGKYEVDKRSVIMGAVVATGAGLVALGIKKLLDARAIDDELSEPTDADEEYEEFLDYIEEKEDMLYDTRDCKVKTGIISIVGGSLVAAVGVFFLTPYREYVLESDAVKKIKDVDFIDRVKSIDIVDKVKNVDFVDRVKDSDIVEKIKDSDVYEKVRDIDVADKLRNSEVAKKLKEIERIRFGVRRLRAFADMLEKKLDDVVKKIV